MSKPYNIYDMWDSIADLREVDTLLDPVWHHFITIVLKVACANSGPSIPNEEARSYYALGQVRELVKALDRNLS